MFPHHFNDAFEKCLYCTHTLFQKIALQITSSTAIIHRHVHTNYFMYTPQQAK